MFIRAACRCSSTALPMRAFARHSGAATKAQIELGEASTVAAPSSDSTPTSTSDLVSSSVSVPVPALPSRPSRASDIKFRGPMAQDIDGGARYITSIDRHWSNIPDHIKKSFETPSSKGQILGGEAPGMLDSMTSQAKELILATGFAPARWSESPATYYGGQLPLAPYSKGQTAAYNYPETLVPREIAYRFPLDMLVEPVFVTTDPAHRWKMKGITLFSRLQGRTTLLFVFSGEPLSGLYTGLKRWFDEIGDDFLKLPKTQVLKLHSTKSWIGRKTSNLTKFHLRRQVGDSELLKTFVYKGKWKWEYERALHMYNKDLPVVLLIDPLAYVRWHAVGLPTDEATSLFRSLSPSLAREKRAYA